ncbi:MAG: hypothetical protein Q9M31_07655, partial [Mariprofundus sp.]|nr:hypothetical protein [Mariprofundus sp.]
MHKYLNNIAYDEAGAVRLDQCQGFSQMLDIMDSMQCTLSQLLGDHGSHVVERCMQDELTRNVIDLAHTSN